MLGRHQIVVWPEFWLEIHLTNQVLADNHTIFLRIEDADDNDPDSQRFFDLPISIEVGEGNPELKIVQVSWNALSKELLN